MLWAYSEESEPAATATSHMMPAETRTGRTAMHPKTMRQQSPQHDGAQRATSARKSFQRAQLGASMTTEYRERFLPHSCHSTFFITSVMKGPNHPLEAMGNDVANERMKSPAQPPKPCIQPKYQWGWTNPPRNPVVNQMANTVQKYKTVYQHDFQAKNADRRQPYKLIDCLKNEGSRPFESITSYRSDYVSHPVQPRIRRPVYKPTNEVFFYPKVSLRPKGTPNTNQELLNKDGEFLKPFKNLSLETKVQDRGKTKEFSPPAGLNRFLSTTHADYRAHKCQRPKPIMPPMQIREKSKGPFQATTTMKEDYKAWNTRTFPTVHTEELGWDKKTSFSLEPAKGCRTYPKPLSLENVTVAQKVSFNATE